MQGEEKKQPVCSRVFWKDFVQKVHGFFGKILSRKCISLFSLNTFDVVDVDDDDDDDDDDNVDDETG